MLYLNKKFKINHQINLSNKKIKLNYDLNSDFKSISNLFIFINNLGCKQLTFNENITLLNNDLNIFFRSNIFIKNIKYITNFLFIGNFPRFETSVLNLIYRKNFNKQFSFFYNINNWNDWTFKTFQKGNSLKYYSIFIQGKTKLLNIFKNTKKLHINTNLNKFIHLNNFTFNIFINKILIKKNYLYMNKLNNFNFIENNTSIINFNEFYYINKNNLNNKINEKFDEVHCLNHFNDLNLNFKTLINYTSHNQIPLNNKNNIFLPISTNFEKNNISINLEGKILKGSKIINLLNKNIKHIENVIETIFLINDELNFNIYEFNYNIKTINKKKYLKNFKSEKRNFLNINKFLKNNYLLNFIQFYKKKNLYLFSNLYNLPENINLISDNYFFKNKINLYFQSNNYLNNNSINMSILTFFNTNFKKLP